MKKSLVLVFLVLIATSVSAGEINVLDFSDTPVIVKDIQKGDLVRFVINGKTHNLILSDILVSKNFIKITLFVEDSPTPSYISLGYNQRLSLDFYKDRVDDMTIVLESLNPDRARLIFRILDEKGMPVSTSNSEQNGSEITGDIVAESGSSPNARTGLIITAAIIIIGLVIAAIFFKK